MTTLNEMSLLRKECETMLSHPFTEYTSKYMEKVEDKAESKKLFQRMLRSIGEWDPEKIEREFRRFMKWCIKKGVSEEDIKTLLNQFVVLSLRIMLSKKVTNEMVKDYQINIQDLFYKCMRRTASKLYESIRNASVGNIIGKKETNNIVVACLYEFIPLEKLIEIIELFKEENESTHSYDFNKTFSDSEGTKGNIVVEKEDSKNSDDSNTSNNTNTSSEHEPQLEYVPSENIEEDYFGFRENGQETKDKEDIKEIKLPKYKQKGQSYYKTKLENSKQRVNEKDEPFFTE